MESKMTKLISKDDFELKENLIILDKQLNQTGKNLNYAKISLLLSNLFFAFSSFTIKLINNHKSHYNYNSFSFIRFLVMFMVSYKSLLYKNIIFDSFFITKESIWFYVRIASNHFSLMFFTFALFHIRLCTATCVYMIFPIFTNILSFFFLKEKLLATNLIGCFVCFIGFICFTISEKENNINKKLNEQFLQIGIIIGIFFSILDGFFTSLLTVATKFLMNKMTSIQLNMHCGLYLSAFSLFCGFYEFKQFLSDLIDPYFVFLSIINGLVVYGAFHYLNESADNADLSKTAFINYTQVIFNIFVSSLFFKEHFGIMDLLGSLFIIGTNVYLTMITHNN